MSVFRELCVVLSDEAFAIAKGIVETAVAKAQPSVPTRELSRVSRMLQVFNEHDHPAYRFLLSRYNWRSFSVCRRAIDDRLEFQVQLHCGHRLQMRTLGERLLHMSPMGNMVDEFIAAIDRRVFDAQRCYCVERQP